jgi:hypothetical protein
MKWDLKHFEENFQLADPSSKQGQVMAIMELGYLTGRRVRSLLGLIWENVKLIDENYFTVVLDTGFKSGSTSYTEIQIKVGQAPMLMKVLMNGILECRTGLVFEISDVINFDKICSSMCVHAGYPKGFFTGHSLRLGFVNSRLVAGLIKGYSLHDTLTRVCMVGGWKPTQHSAVCSYITGPTVGIVALAEANPGDKDIIRDITDGQLCIEGWHNISLRAGTIKGSKMAFQMGLWKQFSEIPFHNPDMKNARSLRRQVQQLLPQFFSVLEEVASDPSVWNRQGRDKFDRIDRLLNMLVSSRKITVRSGALVANCTAGELREMLAGQSRHSDVRRVEKKSVVLLGGVDERSVKRMKLAEDSYGRRRLAVHTTTVWK